MKILEMSSRIGETDAVIYWDFFFFFYNLYSLNPMVPKERLSSEWQMYSMEEIGGPFIYVIYAGTPGSSVVGYFAHVR